MPIDLSKIKEKLNPTPDGQDVTRLRTGVVTAVNANGTVDITLSGVTMSGVPRLIGATVVVGQAVQIASYRGSLLVLGGVESSATPSAGLGFVNGNGTNAGSAAVGTTETLLLSVTATRPYQPGRAYRIDADLKFLLNTPPNKGLFRIRQNWVNSGTPGVEIQGVNKPATTNNETDGAFRALFKVAAGGSNVTSTLSLTSQGAGSITVTLSTATCQVNIYDIGKDTDFPFAPAIT